jgi:type II secretion system protein H
VSPRGTQRRPSPAADAPLGRAPRAGFTLVALLGVVVVIGLIGTIVTLNWKSVFPRSQLNSSVRALAATLQATRSDAIARTAEFWIQYDVEQGRYRVVTPFRHGGGVAANDEERMALDWTELPDSVRFQAVAVDGEEYDTGIVQVRFDPLGAASGHVIVLAQDLFEAYYTIEVQALTGLIDFREGIQVRQAPREGDFE